MGSIRVLLADDHTLIRAGIRSLLEKVRKLEVVAEASNGREALQMAHEFQPDIIHSNDSVRISFFFIDIH